MKIADHLAKLRNLDNVRGRLDTHDDFELWFWAGLVGAVNAVNAALHAAGVTREEEFFATQTIDVYLGAGAVPGTWTPCVRFGGDIISIRLQPVTAPLPTALAQACQSLEALEELRDPCVRGDRAVTAALIGEWDAAYRACVGSTATILGLAGHAMP
jgi:hypothetical protein